MRLERAGGILLHPTSFPGPYGIGDLGGEAYRFVDFLHETGQKLWQILPLTPTGYGDSPYAAFSAFAGNPLLISPDILVGQGLLDPADLDDRPVFSDASVEFGPVIEWKMKLLQRSFDLFQDRVGNDGQTLVADFETEHAAWLDDYALFMAAKAAHGGAVWHEWEEGLAHHQPEAVAEWRQRLAGPVAFQKYLQFLFFHQWAALRQYANQRGVQTMGDIPIFVAYDSADVWAHSDLFFLDETGHSTVVAGVPPDYFSATGQYWGNPLYQWERLAQTGYAWWVERFRTSFKLLDIARLDHFRGFEAYWEVPVNQEQTAVNGQWVKGPGAKLFQAVFQTLGDLPIIVEDLGIITPAVDALRQELGFPGMRVLQFAFGNDATNLYLPHNYDPNTLVYSGTHDNTTTAGWFSTVEPELRAKVLRYLDLPLEADYDPAWIAWKLVRLAWGSVADLAIAPLQDLLGLGDEGRMNEPGRAAGNWGWRYHPDSLNQALRERLLDLTLLYARYVPEKNEAES